MSLSNEESLREERDTARAVARAILRMAQEATGRQVVSNHVLTVHPWLRAAEQPECDEDAPVDEQLEGWTCRAGFAPNATRARKP